jgi:hypothetical protein
MSTATSPIVAAVAPAYNPGIVSQQRATVQRGPEERCRPAIDMSRPSEQPEARVCPRRYPVTARFPSLALVDLKDDSHQHADDEAKCFDGMTPAVASIRVVGARSCVLAYLCRENVLMHPRQSGSCQKIVTMAVRLCDDSPGSVTDRRDWHRRREQTGGSACHAFSFSHHHCKLRIEWGGVETR